MFKKINSQLVRSLSAWSALRRTCRGSTAPFGFNCRFSLQITNHCSSGSSLHCSTETPQVKAFLLLLFMACSSKDSFPRCWICLRDCAHCLEWFLHGQDNSGFGFPAEAVEWCPLMLCMNTIVKCVLETFFTEIMSVVNADPVTPLNTKQSFVSDD